MDFKITKIEATDIQDAWFQCIYQVLDVGFKYEIQRGSYVGQTRMEFDKVVVLIKHPYQEPYDLMLPQIPASLNIPNPVENGYIERYMPYLMTSHIESGEQYTYGSRIVDQIPYWVGVLKDTPNTNQAILQIAQPSDYKLSDPPCVVESTNILTKGGYKACNDITVGDIVFTHEGNWKRVLKVYKRLYKGIVNEITLKGIKKKLCVTPEHLIHIVQIEKCPYENKLNCKKTCKKQFSVYEKNGATCPKVYESYEDQWIQVNKLTTQSYVKVPIIQDEFACAFSKDKMFLFGLWLAEGDYSKKDGIRFNFGQHEKGEFAYLEVNRIMATEYDLVGGKTIREDNCIRQTFYSRALYTKFFEMFRKDARHKQIPFDFIFSGRGKLQALLDGYILGDGYTRIRGKNEMSEQVSFYTTSIHLKEFFIMALLTLGQIPSITSTRPKDSMIKGRVLKSNGIGYAISFTNNRSRSMYSYIDDGYCYIPILNNKQLEYDGFVYNYEVEDDNSYVAESIPVHNCLRQIDMRIKDNHLIFYPYFRSWDLWGGFPANLAGIAVLQKSMADEIGVESGPICASSKGLHIYGYVEELAKLRTGRG